MKQCLLIGVMIIIVILHACSGKTDKQQAVDDSGQKKETTSAQAVAKGSYKIKSGYMKSKVSAFNMIQKTWFDNYGAVQRMETIMGEDESNPENVSISIFRDGYMYTFKNDSTPGTRIASAYAGTMMNYDDLSPEDIKRYGFKKIGKETVNGKECDVIAIEKYNTKAWIWKGISLKTILKSGQMEMQTEAVEFREEAVDPALFELPEGKVFN